MDQSSRSEVDEPFSVHTTNSYAASTCPSAEQIAAALQKHIQDNYQGWS